MRWLLGAVFLVVALVALVFLVGALLPAAHVASRSAGLSAPPERVWAVMTAVDDFPRWRPGVRAVEVLDAAGGARRWREHESAEKRDRGITYEVIESAPPHRLVTRIADAGLPFGGRWEYDLAPDGSGTRLTITERGEVYNPLFRFLSRFVFGHTATMEKYLAALERRLTASSRSP